MSFVDPEVVKIPAFQRKKSLAKRAEKVIPWTAFDRQRQAILKEQKKVNRYVDPVASFRSSKKKIYQQKVSGLPGSKFDQPGFSPPVSVPEQSSGSKKSFSTARYQIIGTVTHYLDRIQVAIIDLFVGLKKDDLVAIEDENGIFFQSVSSMQINRKDVRTAKKGSEIGMKVNQIPKIGGKVFKGKLPL